MADLAPAAPLRSGASLDEPAPGSATPRPPMWRGWGGGVAMLVVTLAPQALAMFVGSRDLHVRLSANSGLDFAPALGALPGIAAFVMVARLVGYRRRDVLWMALPIMNVYLAWVAGARVVQLRPGDAPERWVGSREGTAAAWVLQCLVVAVYVAWMAAVLVWVLVNVPG